MSWDVFCENLGFLIYFQYLCLLHLSFCSHVSCPLPVAPIPLSGPFQGLDLAGSTTKDKHEARTPLARPVLPLRVFPSHTVNHNALRFCTDQVLS
ncbi:hypothetical protein V8F06_010862 [Rhypophila decipiens]